MKPSRQGFTLIEVIVALAICAGALVMLASIGNESLRRSLRARQAAIVDQVCRNKLAVHVCGADAVREGELSNLPGWRWRVEVEAVPLEDVSGLERVTLRAWPSDGSSAEQSMSVLRYRPGSER